MIFLNIILGRVSSATHELIFKAENIPPLGFKSYFISKNAQVASEQVVIGDDLPTSGRQTKTFLGKYVFNYVNYKLQSVQFKELIVTLILVSGNFLLHFHDKI